MLSHNGKNHKFYKEISTVLMPKLANEFRYLIVKSSLGIWDDLVTNEKTGPSNHIYMLN